MSQWQKDHWAVTPQHTQGSKEAAEQEGIVEMTTSQWLAVVISSLSTGTHHHHQEINKSIKKLSLRQYLNYSGVAIRDCQCVSFRCCI